MSRHRRGQIGRAAARSAPATEVVGGGFRLYELEAIVGTLEARFIGHGMAGLDHADAPCRPIAMAAWFAMPVRRAGSSFSVRIVLFAAAAMAAAPLRRRRGR